MKLIFTSLLIAGAAFADTVTDWNAIMRQTIRTEGAHVQSRYAAITQLAVFEAVNSVTKEFTPYLGYVPGAGVASADAAAATAAHKVLSTYFPASADTLDAERTRTLAAIPDGPAKTAGIAVGEAAASAIMAHRASDGASIPVPYTPMPGIGRWQPTPPAMAPAVATNWGHVTPFALDSAAQFRPGPPPALTSSRYTRDYNEIRQMGGAFSPSRPEDRTAIARYMAMTSPTQIWNDIAVQFSKADNLTMSETARALALMNMAVADAAIAVFEAKYHYNYWRPVTAIRAGSNDGNPRTESDPGFTTLINAPAYPSYPSGFGAFSNAARHALELVFGRHRQPFALPANSNLPNMTLQYTKLRDLTDDIADARVYGGIHFRFEQDEAEIMGEDIARYIVARRMAPACAAMCE